MCRPLPEGWQALKSKDHNPHHRALPRFDRHFFTAGENFTYIGSGSMGGKAHGLARMMGALESSVWDEFAPDMRVDLPATTVICTDYFDLFMKENDLYERAYTETRDDLIAHAFQTASLPVQLVGDLRSLAEQVHRPLAVRSSSMLEDAMFEPFASVYGTKMIPNNQPDADTRFRRLDEAIKYVYASTFFRDARDYMKATHHSTQDEKMAVIIQEVVGTRFDVRFYPHISGVARSHNFYPTGNASAADGVVDLALGLGKTIVDDATAWTYSPAYPAANPPYNTISELLKQTQTRFWAVNMGKPPAHDPISETEYLLRCDLKAAEYDTSLKHLASTYSADRDRIVMGTGVPGPRLLNFGPILAGDRFPLNDVIKMLLKTCEETLESLVEIEFAVALDPADRQPAQFAFLQVRPMVVSRDKVEIDPDELTGPGVLAASDRVMGNGMRDDIRDVVYVKPESFDVDHSRTIAAELDSINSKLLDAKRPYVLVGFGRWGTSDPQGGIPVKFSQISGARVIVEATLPQVDFTLSQGSHFFHNLTSFKIFYLSIHHSGDYGVNWDRLAALPSATETQFVRHVEFDSPLKVKVDGESGLGLILYEA
jgi:hypothetical protein